MLSNVAATTGSAFYLHTGAEHVHNNLNGVRLPSSGWKKKCYQVSVLSHCVAFGLSIFLSNFSNKVSVISTGQKS